MIFHFISKLLRIHITKYSALKFTALAAACLMAAFPCYGQDDKTITVQFLSFPKSINPEPVELVVGDGETIKVEIPTNALSKPYIVSAMETWAVGKTETANDQGRKKTIFTTYGQAPALTSSKQLIILIRKGKENADGMQVIPIDNQFDKFGGGQFFFFNASKVDIAGKLAGSTFALKPGAYTIIKPTAGILEHEGLNYAFTELYFRNQEETRPFFSSTWPVNDKARSMIFFYHDAHNDRVRFHSIRNFIR